MIHSSFHRKEDRFIMSIIQWHVRTSGWCVAITIKPRGHVEIDNILDDLSYQTDVTLDVVPIIKIELVKDLIDTYVLMIMMMKI